LDEGPNTAERTMQPRAAGNGGINKKRARFNELMDRVEGFRCKDIVAIGDLCELTIPEMFKLVQAQYEKQITKNTSD
jgi:hypothetical protein